MKPLVVLLASFVIAFWVTYLVGLGWLPIAAGNIAMSVMLLFTALGHFVLREGMAKMLPPVIPFAVPVILVTGFLEMLAAVGLLIPELRAFTAKALILFFILILPANIYAASQKLNYEKGSNDGPGWKYLWFRIPLQLFFIIWVIYFGL